MVASCVLLRACVCGPFLFLSFSFESFHVVMAMAMTCPSASVHCSFVGALTSTAPIKRKNEFEFEFETRNNRDVLVGIKTLTTLLTSDTQSKIFFSLFPRLPPLWKVTQTARTAARDVQTTTTTGFFFSFSGIVVTRC